MKNKKTKIGIERAVEMAQNHINANNTILPDIELKVLKNNDGCHLGTVMRTFINYARPEGVLGVLGPPCSEIVEPVASKQHYYLFIYSYTDNFVVTLKGHISRIGIVSLGCVVFFWTHISSLYLACALCVCVSKSAFCLQI